MHDETIEQWRKRCIKMNARAVRVMKRAGYKDKADLIRAELRRRGIDAEKLAKQRKAEQERIERLRNTPPECVVAFIAGLNMGLRDGKLVNGRRTCRDVIEDVCAMHAVAYEQVVGPRRTKKLVSVRYAAYYRCVLETQASIPMIAKVFDRDHTSIIHGVNAYCKRNNLPDPREPGTRWRLGDGLVRG